MRDKRVFLLGEDIGVYGGVYAVTKGLLDEFGSERVRDTPILEAATGAAVAGASPIAEIMYIGSIIFAMDQFPRKGIDVYQAFL